MHLPDLRTALMRHKIRTFRNWKEGFYGKDQEFLRRFEHPNFLKFGTYIQHKTKLPTINSK